MKIVFPFYYFLKILKFNIRTEFPKQLIPYVIDSFSDMKSKIIERKEMEYECQLYLFLSFY